MPKNDNESELSKFYLVARLLGYNNSEIEKMSYDDLMELSKDLPGQMKFVAEFFSDCVSLGIAKYLSKK